MAEEAIKQETNEEETVEVTLDEKKLKQRQSQKKSNHQR